MFNSIILAGGESTKIGENKALLNVSGKPLISTVVEKLSNISKNIYIVTDKPEEYSFLDNVIFISDADVEKKSILQAIYLGLLASDENYNFICSCDLPYLKTSLVKYLFEIKNNFDVVCPIVNNKTVTLHTIYSKTCLPSIKKVLDKGNKKVIRIFRDLNIKYVPEQALSTEDEKLMSFFQVRTYLDYMLIQSDF